MNFYWVLLANLNKSVMRVSWALNLLIYGKRERRGSIMGYERSIYHHDASPDRLVLRVVRWYSPLRLALEQGLWCIPQLAEWKPTWRVFNAVVGSRNAAVAQQIEVARVCIRPLQPAFGEPPAPNSLSFSLSANSDFSYVVVLPARFAATIILALTGEKL